MSKISNPIRALTLKKLSSFPNLLAAYYECRCGKRMKESATQFELIYEKEILKLQKELLNKTWRPQRPFCFVVTDPKIREIQASDFRDRVVHHALCRLLIPIFEPSFIYDSYACRVNKGTHRAVKRLKSFIRRVTRNYTRQAYYLQADIYSYFTSMKHNILLNLLKERIKNPDILWLLKKIITPDSLYKPVKRGQMSLFPKVPRHKSLFYVPHNQGLPIGNLTSQFFANVYLNQLDQYVKHRLQARYYLRYIDDFLILENDPELLKRYRQKMACFLQEKLSLRLHPRKQIIRSIESGVDFLGYFVKPHYVLVRRRVVATLKRKLKEYQGALAQGDIDWDFVLSSINAYYAHFMHADSYNLRLHLWKRHFGNLRKFLEPVDHFRYFVKKIIGNR